MIPAVINQDAVLALYRAGAVTYRKAATAQQADMLVASLDRLVADGLARKGSMPNKYYLDYLPAVWARDELAKE